VACPADHAATPTTVATRAVRLSHRTTPATERRVIDSETCRDPYTGGLPLRPGPAGFLQTRWMIDSAPPTIRTPTTSPTSGRAGRGITHLGWKIGEGGVEPGERFVPPHQLQALVEAWRDGAPGEGDPHRHEEHARLHALPLAGGVQGRLDRLGSPRIDLGQRIAGGPQRRGRALVLAHLLPGGRISLGRAEQEPGEARELAQHAHLLLHE